MLFLSNGLQIQILIFLVKLAIRFKGIGILPGRLKCRGNGILRKTAGMSSVSLTLQV